MSRHISKSKNFPSDISSDSSHHTAVSELEIPEAFIALGLDHKLLKAIQSQNFNEPTEIQQKVIPIIMDGKDLMASAQTGAGKTLAFVLPILHRLLEPSEQVGNGPRALILTPTRELAEQVTDAIRKMGRFTTLRFGVVTGGVGYFGQEQLFRKPLDVLVATPGRLMDHMDRGRIDFSRLELFILDEADRMLDMGFIGDIEKIMLTMPEARQTLLFSATLEGEVQNIARRFMRDPVSVRLALNAQTPTLIEQRIHQADNFTHKQALLAHVLEDPNVWQAIVFTETKRSAEELAHDLTSKNIICAALHGDMKQNKRSQTLDRMRKGKLRVLVATDVAARGIDVKNISHVINFDLPRSVESYIHRIGRTGRAGESGTAISLVGPNDWQQISQIERATGKRLERHVISGLEPKSGEPSGKSGGGRSGGRTSRNSSRSGGNSSRGGYSRNGYSRGDGSFGGSSREGGRSGRGNDNNRNARGNDGERFRNSSDRSRSSEDRRSGRGERSSGNGERWGRNSDASRRDNAGRDFAAGRGRNAHRGNGAEREVADSHRDRNRGRDNGFGRDTLETSRGHVSRKRNDTRDDNISRDNNERRGNRTRRGEAEFGRDRNMSQSRGGNRNAVRNDAGSNKSENGRKDFRKNDSRKNNSNFKIKKVYTNDGQGKARSAGKNRTREFA